MTIAWHDWCVKVPGRKKSEDTTEKILVAAIQRFSKFGYRRTSINDVAEEAGLARATVYLYWKRKQDLFVAGLERFNTPYLMLVENAAAKKGSAEERILATVLAQYVVTSLLRSADAVARHARPTPTLCPRLRPREPWPRSRKSLSSRRERP